MASKDKCISEKEKEELSIYEHNEALLESEYFNFLDVMCWFAAQGKLSTNYILKNVYPFLEIPYKRYKELYPSIMRIYLKYEGIGKDTEMPFWRRWFLKGFSLGAICSE
jgi:hypothetical protein